MAGDAGAWVAQMAYAEAASVLGRKEGTGKKSMHRNALDCSSTNGVYHPYMTIRDVIGIMLSTHHATHVSWVYLPLVGTAGACQALFLIANRATDHTMNHANTM